MAQDRLQKILARGGISSRRAAESLITEGRVRVNGRVVTELGAKADPRNDKIEVDGKKVIAEHLVYYVLHKPRGYVTTLDDPEGRATILDLIKPHRIPERLYPVGRLDFSTSGVLLLTNDGAFSQGLLHPKKAVPKTYIVKAHGKMTPADLDVWRDGVMLDDGKTLPAEAMLLRYDEKEGEAPKTWFQVTIQEGRNQQIRRMGEATRFTVMRLSRTSFAGINAENLPPGALRPLSYDELVVLKKEYGVPKSTGGARDMVGKAIEAVVPELARSRGSERRIQQKHLDQRRSETQRAEYENEQRPGRAEGKVDRVRVEGARLENARPQSPRPEFAERAAQSGRSKPAFNPRARNSEAGTGSFARPNRPSATRETAHDGTREPRLDTRPGGATKSRRDEGGRADPRSRTREPSDSRGRKGGRSDRGSTAERPASGGRRAGRTAHAEGRPDSRGPRPSGPRDSGEDLRRGPAKFGKPVFARKGEPSDRGESPRPRNAPSRNAPRPIAGARSGGGGPQFEAAEEKKVRRGAGRHLGGAAGRHAGEAAKREKFETNKREGGKREGGKREGVAGRREEKSARSPSKSSSSEQGFKSGFKAREGKSDGGRGGDSPAKERRSSSPRKNPRGSSPAKSRR